MPDITVTVPGRPEFVRVLRIVVASAAARLDFTLDRIDDLRIAVDEACAQLLALGGSATLTMRISPSGGEVEVVVSADTDAIEHGWPPREAEKTLAWRVLTGLADEARFEVLEHGPAVRIKKRGGPM